MSPKRPPSVMGDDERAMIGRGRTPVSGVPVAIEHHEETTPPPAEPPDITQIEGFDKLDPVTREALLALHATDREQDVAMTRLWETRHIGGDVAKMQTEIAILIERTKGLPQIAAGVASLGGVVARLSVHLDEQSKRDQRLEDTLGSLDKRLDRIEVDHKGFETELEGLEERVDEKDGEAMKAIDATEDRHTQLETRVRSLEDTRTKARGAYAVIIVVASALGAAAAFVIQHIGAWFGIGSGAK